MKNTKKLLLPALCVLLGTGKVSAGDEAIAAIGGFVGGVIATRVFDHHNQHDRYRDVVYIEGRCGSSCRHPSHGHGPKAYKHGHKNHRCDHKCSYYKPSGYYETVRVKEWVPGCWRVRYDRCGTRIKYWEPGYSTYVNKRAWVSIGSDRNGRHKYASRGHH